MFFQILIGVLSIHLLWNVIDLIIQKKIERIDPIDMSKFPKCKLKLKRKFEP